MGQSFIVDNQSGAGGAIGARQAARAESDGYTLSVATVYTLAVIPACRPEGVGYDPLLDFFPLSNFANVPNVVEVNPQFPTKRLKQFVQMLKDNPGKYSYGSSGQCSVLHLFGEAFKMAIGTDAIHIPYKAPGQRLATR